MASPDATSLARYIQKGSALRGFLLTLITEVFFLCCLQSPSVPSFSWFLLRSYGRTHFELRSQANEYCFNFRCSPGGLVF
ncbi:hypothetical protein ASPSYDRAFT_44175 [Aspergillus sydowii CBS 593.65]|uniref:Uncharacterized protein n=1 Tax=Aspergillus sydowii CBS 593.65 TaxID=1036612 RepID=A0A1L9TKF8_9EURO|nr:uncharacterized protein ASPSYDRAFT_44175 [Aspergillus sydowii CBS 593.65]OJJ59783.1 hypothetical protein ASPSYDRAFT_44175 [Aspergillus sydowii CBS 593.65]